MKMLRRSFLALLASIVAFFFPKRSKAAALALPAPELHTHRFGPTVRKTRICKNPGCHAFQYLEEGIWKTPNKPESPGACPWPNHVEEGAFVQQHLISTDIGQMFDHIVAYVEKTGDMDIRVADDPFARMIGYSSGETNNVVHTWQIGLVDVKKSWPEMSLAKVEVLRTYIATTAGRQKLGQAMVKAGLSYRDAILNYNGIG